MIEHQKHIEAFEHLMSLGGQATKGNCSEVSAKAQISTRTFWEWYKNFGWKERVEQRNIEIKRKLAEKTDSTIVREKANYRKIIKALVGDYAQRLMKVQKKLRETKPDAYDLEQLSEEERKILIKDVLDLDRVAKLDLLLMGEAVEEVGDTQNLTQPEILRRFVALLESSDAGGNGEITKIKKRISDNLPE